MEQAALDLSLGPDEAGLSVYRVNDAEEAKAVATSWALEHRDRDDHADYVLFDESEAEGTHTLVAKEDPDARDLRLRTLHHELEERQVGAHRVLAARLLASATLQLHRILKTEIAAARRARNNDGR